MNLIFRILARCFQVLFCIRRKIVYIGGTDNVNLGDNAQRLLIRKWCKENYSGHRYIEISIGETASHPNGIKHYFVFSALSATLFTLLRITQRKGDLFVAGSGYGMIDHASNWLAYARLSVSCQKTPILIMPQTINFYNLWVGMTAAEAYNSHPNILLLCRDFVSYEKAKAQFNHCNILPFPDIVTSMIGTKVFKKKREGVLFCVRDDKEAFYGTNDIKKLERKFRCRVEEKDTTLQISRKEMDKNREKLIDDFIDYVAGFKVTITDRYHGTIFSLVANTPVVVLNSVDHKLSSGVQWFPDQFSDFIKFASTLDEAYLIASHYLEMEDSVARLPTYFKDKYWNHLKEQVDKTFFNQ